MANPIATTGSTAVSTEQPDPSQCPLCSAASQCAVAQGASIDSCWCAGAQISRDVLDTIPAALRNRTCLCPQCATGNDSGRGTVSWWSLP